MSQAFSVFLCLTLSLIIILKESQCGLPGAPGPPLLLVLYEGGRPPRLRQLALGLPGPHVGCLRYAPSHTRPCRFSAPGLGGGPREAPGGPNWQLVQKKSATFATRSGSPKLPHSGPPARGGGPREAPGGPNWPLLQKRSATFATRSGSPKLPDSGPPARGGPTGGPWGPELATFGKEIRLVCDAERIPESVASQIHSFSILPHSVHHIYCTHIKLHHMACTT